MKIKKTNVHRLLDKAKITYETHEYAWTEDKLDAIQAAKNAQIPLEKVFKTLVAVGDKTGPLVACVPARTELDLKALAKVSGNKKVEMLAMKDLEKTTGYMRGGCSPIGMKKSFPTYVDSAATELATMIISAGKRGMQVELTPLDLQRILKVEFVDIK